MDLQKDSNLRLIFNAFADPIFLHPYMEVGFGLIEGVNEMACRRYGYTREEFYRMSPPDFTVPDGARRYGKRESRKELDRRKTWLFETVHVTKNGEEIPVEINSNVVEINGRRMIISVIRDISIRKQQEKELEKYRTDLEGLVQTRTEELELSMQQLHLAQKQMLELEKQASLSRLVAGIAHEFNTPLGTGITGISYAADTLRGIDFGDSCTGMDCMNELNTVRESLDLSLKNLMNAAELVNRFKDVSIREDPGTLSDTELCDFLKSLLSSPLMVDALGPHSVEINCLSGVSVQTDIGALARVLTKLVENTRIHGYTDSAPGRISISARTDGDMVTIEYRDFGCGMDDKTRAVVFDPFSIGIRRPGCVGLGMHVAYNIVTRALKGEITCPEPAGEGTQFNIKIPGHPDQQ